jgi:hypothetical protein
MLVEMNWNTLDMMGVRSSLYILSCASCPASLRVPLSTSYAFVLRIKAKLLRNKSSVQLARHSLHYMIREHRCKLQLELAFQCNCRARNHLYARCLLLRLQLIPGRRASLRLYITAKAKGMSISQLDHVIWTSAIFVWICSTVPLL